VTVAYDEFNTDIINVAAVCRANAAREGGYDDMVTMDVLNEAELLNNLRERFARD
jgi:myosin heavy subunit